MLHWQVVVAPAYIAEGDPSGNELMRNPAAIGEERTSQASVFTYCD